MKKHIITGFILLSSIILISCQNRNNNSHRFTITDEATIKQKVDSLLQKLTLNEKLRMLGGTGFATKPIPRLHIPALKMTDGPLGVRWKESTAFPSGTAMAASWDTTLLHKVGAAIGEEVRGKGRHVILGPNVNIARNPRNGRTFEAFGEDPFLTSRMGINYIKGVQSEGVAATVKHFVANTQEYHRNFISSKISPRALHEIYFPAFKAAVQEGHALALMAAYNKLNGIFCSENHYLLSKVLRSDWGFKNLTMSDWGGVHAVMPTETSGLDLEMPMGKFLNADNIKPLIASRQVTEKHINQQVRHILRVIVSLGLMNHPRQKDSTLVNSPEHQKLARQVAREGIVLLENNNLLPLDLSNVDTVTVMGPAAKHVLRGGGSSMVNSTQEVTPWQALKKRFGDNAILNYVPGIISENNIPVASGNHIHTGSQGAKVGLKGNYYANNNFKGSPVYMRTDTAVNFGLGNDTFGTSMGSITPKPDSVFHNGFSMRWKGYISVPTSGTYVINVTDNNGMRFFFDGNQVMKANLHYGINSHNYKVDLKAGKRYPVRLDYFSQGAGVNIKLGLHRSNKYLINKAVKAARASDLVLVFAGQNRYNVSEGHDLNSLRLPSGQNSLLNKVTKANAKTVVILSAGEPVVMDPWNKQAGALLDAWFSGEETGNAITDVLLGDYNPGGKLPITFPKRWKDSPAAKTYKQQDSVAVHQEGILVGYRYFDAHQIKPLYPFGYGLSYTTFSFANITANKKNDAVVISFTVKNTGDKDGEEVAQVYIQKKNSTVKRAPHELKGFSRVHLQAGQAKKVTVSIPRKNFAYYNTGQKKWVVEPGSYTILAGPSSRNLPLQTRVNW